MPISRVEKYKDYRKSLIKEEAPSLETLEINNKTTEQENKDLTSTLPIDQVINNMNDDEVENIYVKKQRRNFILKIALIVLGALILIGGIIVFGIIVWR